MMGGWVSRVMVLGQERSVAFANDLDGRVHHFHFQAEAAVIQRRAAKAEGNFHGRLARKFPPDNLHVLVAAHRLAPDTRLNPAPASWAFTVNSVFLDHPERIRFQ